MKSDKVTHQITAKILQLLDKHKEGLQWAELARKVKSFNPAFHPKTINGIIWKLAQNFPDKVYKPEKGLFRLIKYK